MTYEIPTPGARYSSRLPGWLPTSHPVIEITRVYSNLAVHEAAARGCTLSPVVVCYQFVSREGRVYPSEWRNSWLEHFNRNFDEVPF